MPRLDVSPGTESFVQRGDSSSTYPLPTTNLVGSGAVLADDDDATGFDLGWSIDSQPAYVYAETAMPSVPGASALASLEWHMRMAVTLSGDPSRIISPFAVSIGFVVDIDGFFGAIEADPTFTDLDGVFRDYSGAFPADESLASVGPHVLAGEAVLRVIPTGFVSGATPILFEPFISELWFEYTLVAPVPVETFKAIAPLRMYPRTDGRGASSAPRMYPPPASIQASNRRAGGYL